MPRLNLTAAEIRAARKKAEKKFVEQQHISALERRIAKTKNKGHELLQEYHKILRDVEINKPAVARWLGMYGLAVGPAKRQRGTFVEIWPRDLEGGVKTENIGLHSTTDYSPRAKWWQRFSNLPIPIPFLGRGPIGTLLMIPGIKKIPVLGSFLTHLADANPIFGGMRAAILPEPWDQFPDIKERYEFGKEVGEQKFLEAYREMVNLDVRRKEIERKYNVCKGHLRTLAPNEQLPDLPKVSWFGVVHPLTAPGGEVGSTGPKSIAVNPEMVGELWTAHGTATGKEKTQLRSQLKDAAASMNNWIELTQQKIIPLINDEIAKTPPRKLRRLQALRDRLTEIGNEIAERQRLIGSIATI